MLETNKTKSEIGLLPKARTEKLVVQESGKETLVYDMESEKAHHLNEITSIIWSQCDGETNVEDLCEVLSEKLKAKIESDFVWLALEQLHTANLMESELSAEKLASISRRSVLLKYALPAVALPMVMSLVTPAAAQVASCVAPNNACSTNSECCSNFCEGTCFDIA